MKNNWLLQGRRICPGKLLAEDSLYITIARILWGFDITKAWGESGEPITPNIFAYTDGFNSKPQPFECVIKVRNSRIEGLIESEAQAGERFLDRYLYWNQHIFSSIDDNHSGRNIRS